ncbi:MAG: hypothetical protein IJT59_01340 [Desulfovibrionaceae bacterium]|nr:hypothetical protein [Desulfovibrionaceae bacterium]
MNIRKIREDLGRIQPSCQRRDFNHALVLLISSLKELGGQRAPMDIRQDFRDALITICSDPIFKAVHATPITYTAGKEREILSQLVKVYQAIVGQANKETYEEAAARKLKIDHALRDGKNFLSRGLVSDADTCFAQAVKNYRDENALFAMIAREFMNAKEFARAQGYLKFGLKQAPNDPLLLSLAMQCQRLRAQAGR